MVPGTGSDRRSNNLPQVDCGSKSQGCRTAARGSPEAQAWFPTVSAMTFWLGGFGQVSIPLWALISPPVKVKD